MRDVFGSIAIVLTLLAGRWVRRVQERHHDKTEEFIRDERKRGWRD
jgi:hypothetical protein